MDFLVDHDLIKELYLKLEEIAGVVDTNTDTIYKGIDALQNSWSGTDYEDFKTKAEGYKKYFDSMAEQYRVVGELLRVIVNGEMVKTLFDAIDEAYEELGGS